MEAIAICTWGLLAAFALAATQIPLLNGGSLHDNLELPGSNSEQVSLDNAQDASGTYSASAPRLGAVASENRMCSRIGTDLLTAGGNAADAVRPHRLHPGPYGRG